MIIIQNITMKLKKNEKKVLITGSEGFIGSHLVDFLLKKKMNIRCFVQYNSFSNYGWLDNYTDKNNLDFHLGDIRDSNYVDKAVFGCSHVIHLASLIAIPHSYNSAQSYIDTNIKGTLNLLQSSVKYKIKKFIHTSTSEVYGTAQKIPIDEKHPLNAQSPYAASKIAADHLALSFFKSFNLPVGILRPFNTYGPRQSARAIIPTIITQLINKNKIQLGDINPLRDFNYVNDIVKAFYLAIDNKSITGEVVNLGSNYEISIKNLKNLIMKIYNKKIKIEINPKRLRPRKSEVMRLLCNNSKAKKLLNWKPEYSGKKGLERGLKETIEWFSDNNNLKKYKSNIYNT